MTYVQWHVKRSRMRVACFSVAWSLLLGRNGWIKD